MPVAILPYQPQHRDAIIALSLRAWAPVFEAMKPAVQPYVYAAFYPDGWAARQAADIAAFLESDAPQIRVAAEDGKLLGWVGIRLHPDDGMGEIYIIAVDPAAQGQGIGAALIEDAHRRMRDAGMKIVMVETGDDPGHAASRATYEKMGFSRWPVARYFREL